MRSSPGLPPGEEPPPSSQVRDLYQSRPVLGGCATFVFAVLLALFVSGVLGSFNPSFAVLGPAVGLAVLVSAAVYSFRVGGSRALAGFALPTAAGFVVVGACVSILAP